jgi:hypothetical protein
VFCFLQNLEKALRITELQGETFELLQELFVDDPTEDFYGDTHEEMRNLKVCCYFFMIYSS